MVNVIDKAIWLTHFNERITKTSNSSQKFCGPKKLYDLLAKVITANYILQLFEWAI